MSGKSARNRNRAQATPPARSTARDQKRAQFEGPQRRTGLHLLLAVVALAAVAAVAVVVVTRGDAGPAAEAAPVAAAGGSVSIPLADISDGQASFYSYDAGGVEVKYFVLKSSDGEYRAAFDACDVCYASKKGYHQEGDEMVCNNCGRRFASTKINVLEGGCNPSPLDRSVKGDTLVLNTADIETGAKYFQ